MKQIHVEPNADSLGHEYFVRYCVKTETMYVTYKDQSAVIYVQHATTLIIQQANLTTSHKLVKSSK